MSFLNPWGLLFSLLIPGVIVLYLLKQQHEEIEVSSTYLWEKTLEDIQSSVPWQKLRRSLLLLLQILAIAIFTLAVARPYFSNQTGGQYYVVILDGSASMQAQDVSPSRFEKARAEIERLIGGMIPSDRMTLISADHQARIVVNEASDQGLLKQRLHDLKATNGQSSMKEALSLAEAKVRDVESPEIYIYSDRSYEFEQGYYHSVLISNNGDNRAITKVSHASGSEGTIVLSQIANYGSKASVTLECLADGDTVDVKEIELEEGQKANVYWNNIPQNTSKVEIQILDSDNLSMDNRGWTVLDERKANKVLLVTNRNVFVEKAVKLREDLELVKTTFEQAEGMKGFQLYIYDGFVPEKLPEDGSLIFFNPDSSHDEFTLEGEVEPGTVKMNGQSSYVDILQYVQADQFHVAKASQLTVPSWGEVLFGDGEHPLLVVGELKNQRIALFPFDLHDSDLPLKTDFPILVQNLLAWMLPPVVDRDIQSTAGQEINIHPLPHARAVDVVNPSGEQKRLGPPFPVSPYFDTNTLGIYTVKQDLGDKVVEGYFAIQFPTQTESDLRIGQEKVEAQAGDKQSSPPVGRKEYWQYLVWLVLLLITAEWWVYQRGY